MRHRKSNRMKEEVVNEVINSEMFLEELYIILFKEFNKQHFAIKLEIEDWETEHVYQDELTFRCEECLSEECFSKLNELIISHLGDIPFNIIDADEFDPKDENIIKF